MITVTEYESLGKGKLRVRFDNEAELILYRGEAKQWKLREEAEISEEDYQKLLTEVVENVQRNALCICWSVWIVQKNN